MLAACERRNSPQLDSSRRGAGSTPASRRIVQTVLAAIPYAEPNELALDPPVSPARVLARQPQDQLAHVGGRLRTTRTTMRIRPAARD
jgi:hypothetical protein